MLASLAQVNRAFIAREFFRAMLSMWPQSPCVWRTTVTCSVGVLTFNFDTVLLSGLDTVACSVGVLTRIEEVRLDHRYPRLRCAAFIRHGRFPCHVLSAHQ